MGQMAARGVVMENLQEKELDGDHGGEDAITPPGIANVDTGRLDRRGLQLCRPVRLQPLQNGHNTWHHRECSCRSDKLPVILTGDGLVLQQAYAYKIRGLPPI